MAAESNKESWESYEVRQNLVRVRRPRRIAWCAGASDRFPGRWLGVLPAPFVSRDLHGGDALHAHRRGERSIVGGTILNSDQPFADIPKGAIAGGNFLSAGPTTTQDSTIQFDSGLSYVSFLWGSPDLYNALTVKTTAGDVPFTASGLGFSVTNGDQSFSTYVQFTADAGVAINGLVFSNVPSVDAFEVANFNVTAAVPEPETYVLMLAGSAPWAS